MSASKIGKVSLPQAPLTRTASEGRCACEGPGCAVCAMEPPPWKNSLPSDFSSAVAVGALPLRYHR